MNDDDGNNLIALSDLTYISQEFTHENDTKNYVKLNETLNIELKKLYQNYSCTVFLKVQKQ